MNQYIKIKKQENGDYIIEKTCDNPLDLIYYFLCGDAGPSYDWTISFLRNSDSHDMSFNFCSLHKENQEHIVLSSLYEEEMPIGEVYCTIEQLVKLIEDWKKVVEQKPEYVYVSQEENGNFTVATSDAKPEDDAILDVITLFEPTVEYIDSSDRS